MHKANLLTKPVDGIDLLHAHYQNHAFKAHFHLDYHVGLVESGQQVFYSNGVKHHTGPGCIQLMMPEQVHDSQTLRNESFVTRIFCISARWVESLTGESGFNRINSFSSSFVEDPALFHQLLSLHHSLQDMNIAQLARECIPLEVFSHLFGRYAKDRVKDEVSLGKQTISRLKDYTMANLQEKIHLQELAAMCDLSESQFLRHFKKATGLTPYKWLLLLRLEHAMSLLKSGLSSTEVAFLVGFYDQAHFIHAFQRNYGLKPRQVQQSRTQR